MALRRTNSTTYRHHRQRGLVPHSGANNAFAANEIIIVIVVVVVVVIIIIIIFIIIGKPVAVVMY